MKKTLATLAFAIMVSLSGCVSVPVIAKASTGEKFVGTATASLASGTFSLASPSSGLRCWGTYNPYDPSLALAVDFQASDGRHGTAIVARDMYGNGMGTGVANDGTKFDFFMGNSIAWNVRSEW